MTESGYKHNHYVPEWYQKRFLEPGRPKLWYLDVKPEVLPNYPHHWPPKRCFAQDDLYTTRWGQIENREIERFFFGKLDNEGKSAVEFFSNYSFQDAAHEAVQTLLPYMSAQRLRTPKGLGNLRQLAKSENENLSLLLLQELHQMYCATWAECIWQVADASRSATKFIISDNPVVIYNRDCFPGSPMCTGYNDPDIRWAASHTYFPLSAEKVLIFTNGAWVRDPYQNPRAMRPNPKLMRAAMMNLQDIQFDRFLSEEEVVQINYITKKRAHRYIAAAKKEWLYPEERLRSTNWRKLGDGYLLMPEPRHVHGGGETFIGYKDGTSTAFDAYGHRPGQKGFGDEQRSNREFETLRRFKEEWASMIGPEYRGLSAHFRVGPNGPATTVPAASHAEDVARDEQRSKRLDERKRRQKLMREHDATGLVD